MTRRMLINAINPAELRVALADDQVLEDFKVDVAERGLTRGNIYFGYIANIQPSLNAAFIDYGAERHGFLPIQDVVPDAYYRDLKKGAKPRIEDVLEKGRPIVVQVTREPEGQKGAALTTNLSLAGRYLVLMPFERTRGISRKVNSDEERRKLAELVEKMRIPQDCGVIVRTNALDQTKTALTRDLNALLRLWKKIGEEARKCKQTKLLYSDQDIVLQALRDNLDSAIEEVVVDAPAAHDRAREYMQAFMPRSKTKLMLFEERIPLFAHYKIEEQIDRIYDRKVALPSGGSIVIDHAEALTAIDVNSGKSTKAASQEETALHTNLEAAVEVARHLRLRDIGGLIVVDFIDMRNRRNQKKTEKALRDAMKADKARFTVGRISSNGLLEINRQRLEQAIQMRTHRSCPTCSGTGRILSPEIVALHLVRAIEARASGGYMRAVRVELHPELADYVQNQRRGELLALEEEFDIEIEIVAANRLHRPEQDVTWTARDREEIKRIERVRAEAAEQAKAKRDADAAALAGKKADADDESTAGEADDEEDDDTGLPFSSIEAPDEDEEDDEEDEASDEDEEDESDEDEEDDANEEDDDEPQDKGDAKPKRRRRRGGRRRRRSASSDRDGAKQSGKDSSSSGSQGARGKGSSGKEDAGRAKAEPKKEDKSAKEQQDSSGEEQSSRRRRRPRRRGGRRGRGGGGQSGQSGQGGQEKPSGGGDRGASTGSGEPAAKKATSGSADAPADASGNDQTGRGARSSAEGNGAGRPPRAQEDGEATKPERSGGADAAAPSALDPFS